MKYKIYDKVNKEYLKPEQYCINQYGDIMTTKGTVLMNQNDFEVQSDIKEILECLIDEVKDSGKSSEWTIDILSRYEDKYDFIKNYFKELEHI